MIVSWPTFLLKLSSNLANNICSFKYSKFNFRGAVLAFHEDKTFCVIFECMSVSDSCSRVCVLFYGFEITSLYSLKCLKSRFCQSIYPYKVAVTFKKVSMGCISDLWECSTEFIFYSLLIKCDVYTRKLLCMWSTASDRRVESGDLFSHLISEVSCCQFTDPKILAPFIAAMALTSSHSPKGWWTHKVCPLAKVFDMVCSQKHKTFPFPVSKARERTSSRRWNSRKFHRGFKLEERPKVPTPYWTRFRFSRWNASANLRL